MERIRHVTTQEPADDSVSRELAWMVPRGTEAGIRPRTHQGSPAARIHSEFGGPVSLYRCLTTPFAPVHPTPPFMSNYSIVMQSSPVAPKKLTALKAYAKKNGIVVSKPVEGKVTLSAVWSETNGTFENDLTPSLAKHLKETVHLLMTISYGQLDDGTGKVEAVYFIKMDPSGEAQRIAIEMDDISGPWTRKSAWPKKAIDWNA